MVEKEMHRATHKHNEHIVLNEHNLSTEYEDNTDKQEF